MFSSAIIPDATILADQEAGLQPRTAWLRTGTAAAATTPTIVWAATTTSSGSVHAFTAESAGPQSTSIRCPRAVTVAQVRVSVDFAMV